jgi:signal transduction histidine kinase
VLLTLATAAVYVSTSSITDGQQKRLLNSRKEQLVSTLGAYMGSITTYMNLLGVASELGAQRFLQTLIVLQSQQSQGQSSSQQEQQQQMDYTLALLHREGSIWSVGFSSSKSFSAKEITGPLRKLVDSATTSVKSIAFKEDNKRYLAFVEHAPLDPNTLVYVQFGTDGVAGFEAFNDLNVALYRSQNATADNLVLMTSPVKGRAVTGEIPIGGEKWSVVVSARSSLSGGLAKNLPWLMVLISLITGSIVIVLIETVVRRRNYAMALVTERTAELRESLDALEKAQSDLVSAQRLAALGEMSATVGHELRNPLAVLTNAMYLIRHTVESNADDRLRRQLDTADREIAAATLIVSDLLEFSRPRPAVAEAVDVADLVHETVTAAPPRTGISLDVDTDGVPPIEGDRAQLRQVLLNLLINAYDAMPEGGKVSIEAHGVNGHVEVSVTDSGVGADPEQLARVFEPFYTSKTKGIGLGLAVSKRIIEGHSGTIALRPAPERGCTATITLPRSAGHVDGVES